MRKSWSLLLLILIVACAQPPSETPPGPTTEERIAAITGFILPAFTVEGEPVDTMDLEQLMAENQVPGVSIAVFRDGEIEWALGFGIADVEDGRAVTPETLFQAASISKPVAATAALRMVEEGLLDLDEDVNQKLTSWKVPANEHTANQPVTLRGLLTHSAGMTVHGFPGYAEGVEVPETVGVLDGHGNTDPIRVDMEPATEWRYSGGGYTVMQQLLIDVAGKPFPEIVREKVLEPAGMSLSSYQQPLPGERALEASSAHGRDGSRIEGKWHTYPEMAAAGLWTTPSDLSRFAMAIQRSRAGQPGALLSQEMARQMLEPSLNNHGLGPAIEGDGSRFGHGGSNAGFRCSFTASIEGGWGIAVMTNGDRGGRVASLLIMTVAKSYGWDAPQPRVLKVVDIGEEALQRIAGDYDVQGIGVLKFEAERGRLYTDVPRQGRLEFLPQSETEIVQSDDGRVFNFVLEDGKITGFTTPGITAKKLN